MDTSSTGPGVRSNTHGLPTPLQDLPGTEQKQGHAQKRPATAKQHRPHQLNDTVQDRPPQDTTPPGFSAVRSGERQVRLHGGKEARTRGRGGHAGAGVSGDLTAGVRGEAGVGWDPQSFRRSPSSSSLTAPLFALNGKATAGAGFEQYAQAGLPPLRLAKETIVEEPLGLGQNSHGFVGARAKAGGSVGATHAQAHGEAFAGAKTGGQTQLTVGDQRFKVSGDLQAGVGLDGAVAAGLRHTAEGRTRAQLEGRIGGALGIGGSVGGGVDLDVTPVANAVGALPRHAHNGAKSVQQSLERAGKALALATQAAVQVVKELVTAPVRFLKALFS
ncbi:hypothetical protein [Xylophilus ampelinus]|uniref:Uncharacterized protein n=1 Tax=Xylophilus ampelinus TaxID=54067 RepID=A0A318SHJ6_9BURK|nr:hypothetical protein [Xylophilus ampelinus]MCS4510403.1 hypothetical protein [Xylophilus ampelinus]PYE77857.1 hypothetical protein DFQ15_1111 [Xylophilus ampelinus]